MENQLKCPKCSGEMEAGVILDKSHFNVPTQPIWGKNVPGPISGLLGSLDNTHEVVTYRCASCGYLESYAK